MNSERACHDLRSLPPAVFDEQQWLILEALMPVLLAAAAELRLVFRAEGAGGFHEVALAALKALGEEEQPTDLALALDYRIQHLLIDEFQDTSITQFELLRKLTAGWEPGDGRTLFAVGDPMQSIYRFREAEVGLFLEAGREGIGRFAWSGCSSANFRSDQGLVDWVNGAFPTCSPNSDDIATGAVRFSASSAMRPGAERAVTVHPFFDEEDEAEAARVVEHIRAARARKPAEKDCDPGARAHASAFDSPGAAARRPALPRGRDRPTGRRGDHAGSAGAHARAAASGGPRRLARHVARAMVRLDAGGPARARRGSRRTHAIWDLLQD